MNISFIQPGHEIIMPGSPSGIEILQHIERCGRTCYKSESQITEDSSLKFIEKIIKLGHESVLEHYSFSVRFVCDRGVTHELVRHRLASFSQESTRYVGYGNAIEFIIPSWCEVLEPCNIKVTDQKSFADVINKLAHANDLEALWAQSVITCAQNYSEMLDKGWKPQQARSILPNSLKTEIVVTANLREWRHILKLRCAAAAHPDIRKIMIALLTKLRSIIPIVFDDIKEYTENVSAKK